MYNIVAVEVFYASIATTTVKSPTTTLSSARCSAAIYGLEDGEPYIEKFYRHLICLDFVTILFQCMLLSICELSSLSVDAIDTPRFP
jgi:hypothetical protein